MLQLNPDCPEHKGPDIFADIWPERSGATPLDVVTVPDEAWVNPDAIPPSASCWLGQDQPVSEAALEEELQYAPTDWVPVPTT